MALQAGSERLRRASCAACGTSRQFEVEAARVAAATSLDAAPLRRLRLDPDARERGRSVPERVMSLIEVLEDDIAHVLLQSLQSVRDRARFSRVCKLALRKTCRCFEDARPPLAEEHQVVTIRFAGPTNSYSIEDVGYTGYLAAIVSRCNGKKIAPDLRNSGLVLQDFGRQHITTVRTGARAPRRFSHPLHHSLAPRSCRNSSSSRRSSAGRRGGARSSTTRTSAAGGSRSGRRGKWSRSARRPRVRLSPPSRAPPRPPPPAQPARRAPRADADAVERLLGWVEIAIDPPKPPPKVVPADVVMEEVPPALTADRVREHLEWGELKKECATRNIKGKKRSELEERLIQALAAEETEAG